MKRLLAAALALAACSSDGAYAPAPAQTIPIAPPGRPKPGAPTGPDAAFRVLSDRITDKILEDEPSIGREAGLRAKYDGRISAYGKAAIEKRVERLRSAEKELSAVDASSLSADGALDRGVLLAHVRLRIFKLAEMEEWRKNPMFYGELFGVNDYLDREYASAEERARALLAHEKAALAALPEVKQNLKSPLAKAFVETSIKVMKGYQSYLETDVPKLLAGVGDAAFQKDLQDTNAALAKGAKALVEHLQVELKKADQSHVLGKERFIRFVEAQEGETIEIEAFRKRGEDDLARNAKAMKKALENPKAKPTRPRATELLALGAKISDDARAFVVSRDLVGVPSDDRCTTKETPPFMRWNAAFLNGPGPFDKPGLPAFYYMTLPDPKLPKKEQEEYVMPRGTLLSTTVHEVYPGHFLQGLWLRKAPTRVQALFSTYSYQEGWAHYVEEMMIEEGFGREDPQNAVGQLADALLRNCRWVGTLAIHVDKKPLDFVARRFEKECGQDKATAREQAVRATFDPGYFAYTYGKRALLDLRAEVKKRLGDKYDKKAFHDAVLSHGSPPLPLLRDRVLRDLTGAP